MAASSPFDKPSSRSVMRRRRGDEEMSTHAEVSAEPPPEAPVPTSSGATDAPGPAASAAGAEQPASHLRAARVDRSAPRQPRQADVAAFDGDALIAEFDALGPDPMAALLGRRAPHEPEVGDSVKGQVVRVEGDAVFVDIGAKSEAVIERADLGDLEPVVGDSVTAIVTRAGGRGIRLAVKVGRADLDALAQAAETGMIVEGRVTGRNTGGFTVKVSGVDAFCPVSHIDLHAGEDLDAYLDRTLSFQVLEVRGKDVVLSRRALAEKEAKEAAEALWERLKAGDRMEGKVVNVREFGVFVDLGGVQGMVHKSELSWDADAPPPAKGDRVEVRVVEIDKARSRISLSMRDPAFGSKGPSEQDRRSSQPRQEQSLGTMADLFAGFKVKR